MPPSRGHCALRRRRRSTALAFLVLPIVAIFVHTSPGKLLDQLSNPVVRDAFVVSLKTSLHRAGPDPALRDADRVPARDAALPRARARGHARRAAARAAAGGRRDRAARRVRPRRAARLDARVLRRSRSRSRRPPSRSRSRTSRARSTSGRRSPRSRRSTRTSPPPRARSAPRGAHVLPRRAAARPRRAVAGLALSFARGLGEFGATIMFAGSLQKRDADAAARDLRRVRPELRRDARDERRARPDQRPPAPGPQNRTDMATLILEAITVPLRSFGLELSLDVDATVALVGPSGAGKTTVLRAIAGLVRPRSGRIARATTTWFDGEAGVSPAARPAARRARLPGLRALPAHDRAPERRVRPPSRPPTSTSSASRSAPRGRAARRALGRRAPARRARARARPRPRGAAARRAALGARRAHEGRRAHRAAGAARRPRASRRCSSRTTSRTPPRSPTTSA